MVLFYCNKHIYNQFCSLVSQTRTHKHVYALSLPGAKINDMVWYGMVWYGMVWYGMVWYGMVWCSVVWYGIYGMVWYGFCNTVRVRVVQTKPLLVVGGGAMDNLKFQYWLSSHWI